MFEKKFLLLICKWSYHAGPSLGRPNTTSIKRQPINLILERPRDRTVHFWAYPNMAFTPQGQTSQLPNLQQQRGKKKLVMMPQISKKKGGEEKARVK